MAVVRVFKSNPTQLKLLDLFKKLKIDQNHKNLNYIGSYFLITVWIGSNFGFDFKN